MLYKHIKCVNINIKHGAPSLRCFHKSSSDLAISTAVQTKETTTNSWESASPYNEIPKASVLEILKNFAFGGKAGSGDLKEFTKYFKEKYGDLYRWPAMFGKSEMLFTQNPADFETIYRNEGIWPTRPGQDTFRYFREKYRADFFQGVEGTLTTHGEKWGSFRSTVNPVLMQPKTMKLYLDKMSEVNLDFVNRIRAIRDPSTLEVPNNFLEEINAWTFESVAMVALDKRMNVLNDNRSTETKQLFKNITETFELFFELDIKPSMWRIVHTPKFKRLMYLLDEARLSVLKHVNESIERLDQEHKQGIERPENEKSVLEKLLKIDKKIATVMAMDLLMAGVDTTSSAFTSVLLSLAKNPEKQQKLREEVLKVLPAKDSKFEPNALDNMPYLRACIKEAFRIFPLTVANIRVPQKDVVLSGFRVPKGQQVIMIFQTLLDSDKYFPEPDKYIPERWLRTEHLEPDFKDKFLKTNDPFVFLPFGFGPRMCLGKRIADMELEVGTARLVRNFNIEFNYSTDKAFKMSAINVPNIPLNFKFTDVEK